MPQNDCRNSSGVLCCKKRSKFFGVDKPRGSLGQLGAGSFCWVLFKVFLFAQYSVYS